MLNRVLENYGVTMYKAQILESDLQIVVSCLSTLGLVSIDRVQYNVTEDKEGVITACIGPMVSWIKHCTMINFPVGFIKDLKKANMLRNQLAHTFLVKHSIQLHNEDGCAVVNGKLNRIYDHLQQVGAAIIQIRNFLYAEYGLTEEIMDQKVKEMLGEFHQPE